MTVQGFGMQQCPGGFGKLRMPVHVLHVILQRLNMRLVTEAREPPQPSNSNSPKPQNLPQNPRSVQVQHSGGGRLMAPPACLGSATRASERLLRVLRCFLAGRRHTGVREPGLPRCSTSRMLQIQVGAFRLEAMGPWRVHSFGELDLWTGLCV